MEYLKEDERRLGYTFKNFMDVQLLLARLVEARKRVEELERGNACSCLPALPVSPDCKVHGMDKEEYAKKHMRHELTDEQRKIEDMYQRAMSLRDITPGTLSAIRENQYTRAYMHAFKHSHDVAWFRAITRDYRRALHNLALAVVVCGPGGQE